MLDDEIPPVGDYDLVIRQLTPDAQRSVMAATATTAPAASPAAVQTDAATAAAAAAPPSFAPAAAARSSLPLRPLPPDPPLPLVRVFRPDGSYEPFEPDSRISDVSAAIQLDGVCGVKARAG